MMTSKLTYTFLIFTLLVGCTMPSKVENAKVEKIEVKEINKHTPIIENKTQIDTQVATTKVEDVEAKAPVLEKKELWPKVKQTKRVSDFCKKVDKKFIHWGWGRSRCRNIEWMNVRRSYLGDPLIWKVYGDESKQKTKPVDMTLIMCGVHGDEITPIKFCFDIIHHLEKVSKGHIPGHENIKDKLVVVAPIVNPDSFFKRRPTRTNARGIDVNRNFPTKDWHRDAKRLWVKRYKKDKRRYPGEKPLSEQETIFQVNLIKRYVPSKIISVHSPLTIIDYDGPELNEHDLEHSHEHGNTILNAKNLLVQMSKKANGYRIKNYPFFPGSLGNYAGNERKIPTYTLELPTSDNRRHKDYWKKFKEAIHSAIIHDMSKNIEVAKHQEEEVPSTN